jgi:aryl-phospho-beta-D-glucosidase BglC (GH1 family)
MERIITTPNNKGFIKKDSKQPFRPWGMNYSNSGRLIEDFWEKDWDTIKGDFREIKSLGDNLVRVHLQYGKFMAACDVVNTQALQKLNQVVKTFSRDRALSGSDGPCLFPPC